MTPAVAGGARPDDGPPLASQVEDAIRLSREQAVFNRVFFFPPFAATLFRDVRGLSRAGFEFSPEEERRTEGKVYGARIVAPTGQILDLGAVLFRGADGEVKVVKPLIDVQELVRFVTRTTATRAA